MIIVEKAKELGLLLAESKEFTRMRTAEQAQQAADIATATQGTNAVAATSGMPAGARAALASQNAAKITGQYANMADQNIATGIQGANQFANTGLNIAGANNQSALTNFLANQQQQNLKTQLLAEYAV